MKYLLALDTSTEASSVALWHQGEVIEDFQLLPRQHAQALIPQIQQLLAQAQISLQQLDALAFGRGPGSFTGLRIAAASVQGLGMALNKPILAVSTLEALAWQAMQDLNTQQVLTLIDARMQEVYWAAWHQENGWPKALIEEQLSAPESLSLPASFATQNWSAVGTGLAYAEVIPAKFLATCQHQQPEALPRAKAIAILAARAWQLGVAVAPEQAVPVYIRDEVVN